MVLQSRDAVGKKCGRDHVHQRLPLVFLQSPPNFRCTDQAPQVLFDEVEQRTGVVVANVTSLRVPERRRPLGNPLCVWGVWPVGWSTLVRLRHFRGPAHHTRLELTLELLMLSVWS